MSNDNFKLGTTKFGGLSNTKQVWHKLEAGDNLYRVLPPLFSLAEKGQYSKFYAFHGGFRNSAGRVNMFRCLEVKDNKTKMIKVHCPVCDMVTENMAKYKLLKDASAAGGASEDQVKKYWMEKVFPFKAQKAFFMNAISQSNATGVLGIPYKAWQSVDHVIQTTHKNLGIDVTGIEGAWIKIKKIQPFVGSRDTSYGAELIYEQDGTSFSLKRHVLSPEAIQTLQATAFDIGNLYRTISLEDAAALVATPAELRGELADRIFAREKPLNADVQNPLEVQIPGTTAKAIGRIENTPDGGFNVASPNLPPGWNTDINSGVIHSSPSNTAGRSSTTVNNGVTYDVPQPKVAAKAATVLNQQAQSNGKQAQVATVTEPSQMSDEEFSNIFGQ